MYQLSLESQAMAPFIAWAATVGSDCLAVFVQASPSLAWALM